MTPVCSTDYFTLWSNGQIGCSDGVGFVGSIEKKEVIDFVQKAYEFLKEEGYIE